MTTSRGNDCDGESGANFFAGGVNPRFASAQREGGRRVDRRLISEPNSYIRG